VWGAQTRAFRRVGQMSLTVYAWMEPLAQLARIPLQRALHARGMSVERAKRQQPAEQAALLGFIVGNYLLWIGVLAAWSRLRYAGAASAGHFAEPSRD